MALNFGTPAQRWVDHLSLAEARRYFAEGVHFAAGSRRRRSVAVIVYLENGGTHAIITDPPNLAEAVAGRTDKDALIVDFDLAAGMVRSILKTSSRYSILDACSNVQRLDRSFWRALIINGDHGFDILGAPVDVDSREVPTVSQIRHVLRFVRTQYEYVFIDFGRGRSHALDCACEELDELLLVATTEVPALIRVRQMVDYLKAKRMNRRIIRLVLNRMVKQPEVGAQDLERLLDMSIFATIPEDNRALHDAYAEGRLLAPESAVRRQIGAMVAKLTGIDQAESQPTSKRFFSAFF